jgi:hypothetical protein
MAEADAVAAANDSIRAMMLVRTYRVRGHLAANLDPLGLSKQDIPPDLTPEYHGFSGAGLDRKACLCRRDAWDSNGRPCVRSSISCAQITAGLSALNICTFPTWRNAASCRNGWKG